MQCPICGRPMKLIRSEVNPKMEELKLVNGKPTKLTVTLKTMTWRCDHKVENAYDKAQESQKQKLREILNDYQRFKEGIFQETPNEQPTPYGRCIL